jgi:hypothetical protein
MKLSELFQNDGLGVIATAGADGSVNTAVYGRPHIIDEATLVWGMTDGRTFRNVSENPHASYLFKESGHGYSGVRIKLELIRTEEGGDLLVSIKKNTDMIVGPGAGNAVTHAGWFKVVEVRPLI